MDRKLLYSNQDNLEYNNENMSTMNKQLTISSEIKTMTSKKAMFLNKI